METRQILTNGGTGGSFFTWGGWFRSLPGHPPPKKYRWPRFTRLPGLPKQAERPTLGVGQVQTNMEGVSTTGQGVVIFTF